MFIKRERSNAMKLSIHVSVFMVATLASGMDRISRRGDLSSMRNRLYALPYAIMGIFHVNDYFHSPHNPLLYSLAS